MAKQGLDAKSCWRKRIARNVEKKWRSSKPGGVKGTHQ